MAREVGRVRRVTTALHQMASLWSLLGQKRCLASESSVAAVQQPSGSGSTGTLGKRFYKNALVRETDQDGLFEICLDSRVLRTPAKKPLRFSNPALAHAVAAEWDWQDSRGIRSFTMPLMKLASIAIDQIPQDKERVIATLLKYCHTDALCCRASPGTVLYEKQVKHWDPLLDWVEAELGVKPVVTSSIFGTSQPQEVVDCLDKNLRAFSNWQLAAIDSLAGSARSLVVALAIARDKLGVDEAIDIIRLEENHQVEDWGYVEGGHDIDEADIRVRISAPSVFLRLL